MKFLILLLIPSLGFAQCEWEENTTDEFTGNRVLTIGYEPVFASLGLTISFGFRRVNEYSLIKMKYTLTGSHYIRIDKDAQLMLKLSNDSIIKIQSADYYSGKTEYYSSSGSYTFIYPDYWITKDQLELLSNYEIVKVRIYLSEGYDEQTCNKTKKLPLIKANAKCLLESN